MPQLHEDIWRKIFCLLPNNDLFVVRTVCRSWNQVATDFLGKKTHLVVFDSMRAKIVLSNRESRCQEHHVNEKHDLLVPHGTPREVIESIFFLFKSLKVVVYTDGDRCPNQEDSSQDVVFKSILSQSSSTLECIVIQTDYNVLLYGIELPFLPNLKHLTFNPMQIGNIYVESGDVKKLFSVAPFLETLTPIQISDYYLDGTVFPKRLRILKGIFEFNDINTLFDSAASKSLEEIDGLEMGDVESLNGTNSLPNLRQLRLITRRCSIESLTTLAQILKRCGNPNQRTQLHLSFHMECFAARPSENEWLEVLTSGVSIIYLGRSVRLGTNQMEGLVNHAPHLEYLSLSSPSTRDSIVLIGRMSNLTKLHYSTENMDHQDRRFLEAMASSLDILFAKKLKSARLDFRITDVDHDFFWQAVRDIRDKQKEAPLISSCQNHGIRSGNKNGKVRHYTIEKEL